jgi:hypothetical protein
MHRDQWRALVDIAITFGFHRELLDQLRDNQPFQNNGAPWSELADY